MTCTRTPNQLALMMDLEPHPLSLSHTALNIFAALFDRGKRDIVVCFVPIFGKECPREEAGRNRVTRPGQNVPWKEGCFREKVESGFLFKLYA